MNDTAELIKTLHDRGIRVWREDDKLRYSAPKGAMSDELRQALANQKEQLLALLARHTPASASAAAPGGNPAVGGTHPIAYPQERRWIWYQFAPEDTGYSLRLSFRLDGLLDDRALERSLYEIVQRHDPLHTSIVTLNGEPCQEALPPVVPLERIDLSALPEPEQLLALKNVYRHTASLPFRLEKGPLFRLVLARLGATAHALLMVVDHAVFDAWSLEIFRRELALCYEAYTADRQPELPEIKFSYNAFARWQRDFVNTDGAQRQLAYWKQVFAVKPPRLDLTRDRVPAKDAANEDDAIDFAVSAELVRDLQALAKENGVTLFMLLLAAYGVLLYRLCGQEDLVVGVPVSGRALPGSDESIGCFVNVLPLRLDLGGHPSYRQLLHRVRDTVLDSFEHQDVPLEILVREIPISRSADATPLFQTMFNLLNVPATSVDSSPIGASGVSIGPLFETRENSMFDLELTLRLVGNSLHGVLSFLPERYSCDRVAHIAESYCELLRSIARCPDEQVDRLELLTEKQRQWLEKASAGPTLSNPDQTVPALIHAQAAATPEHVAVRAGSEVLTYRELDLMANGIAAAVGAAGVEPGSVVALLAPRSPVFLAAMLGIMRAGAAFLPLNPAHPLGRNLDIIAGSGTPLLLIDDAILKDAAPEVGAVLLQVRSLRQVLHEWRDAPASADNSEIGGLAYVLYTSGSTGKPKGAMVLHRGMLNHTMAKLDDLGMGPRDALAQTASQSFDIFVWQMLAPLVRGGSVHIYPDDIARDPERFVRAIQEDGITIVEVVPSLLAFLLEEVRPGSASGFEWRSLRWMIATGEALPPSLCSAWLSQFPNMPLMNAYGPTECSDDVTHHVVATPLPDKDLRVPIGRPIRNTRIYVLDALDNPVLPGTQGEIHVGGMGVGLGYLGDPRRTEAAFVPDRFAGDGNGDARLYRTGDVGRWRLDGALEFLGRQDDQVKIRGQRIELDEIVHVLNQCPGVCESFVMYEPTEHGGRLLAYLRGQPDVHPDAEAVRRTLRTRLPEHMVPSGFVWLAEFPRTASGKIDRETLRRMGGQAIPDESIDKLMPATETEQAVAALWEETLNFSPISSTDDFFTLGGNSLHAVRIAQRIRRKFGIELPLAELFAAPTVQGLSAYIDQARLTNFSPPTRMTVAVMAAEAELEPEISPAAGMRPRTGAPANILLTGATGFLGVAMLAELLKSTDATLYCLVREGGRPGQPSGDPDARLLKRLQEYGEWNDDFNSRVVTVAGDLCKSRFGLSDADYSALAAGIDTVFHAGADVNLLYAYRNLKSVNVDGTREVLRFAVNGQLKRVHHVSTLSMMSSLERQGQVIREDDHLDQVGSLIGGYAQSKWIAEKLIEQARHRGVPVAVYRPHRITGHSRTGAWNMDDMVCHLVRGCLDARVAPDLEATIEFAPVDFVASAIVALSLQDSSLGGNFHLVNKSTVRLTALVKMLNSLGYPLEPVPYVEWQKRMFEAASDPASPSHALMSMFSEQMTTHMLELKSAIEHPEELPEFDTANTDAGLRGTGIICPDLSVELLTTYFRYLTRGDSARTSAVAA